MNISRYLPHPHIMLSFMLGVLWYVFIGKPVMDDPDLPWHLAAGDIIRTTGSIPTTDLWSFTAGETPWYNLSWLWDLGISYLAHWFGLKSLFYFTALCVGTIIATLCYSIRLRNYLSPYAILLTCALALLVFTPALFPRPQLATYLLIIIFHIILHNSRANPSGVWLFSLPALMLLWVNIHGGFLVGFGLLAFYGLESVLTRQWLWTRQLLIVSVLCTVVIPLNPFGLDVFPAVWATLHKSAITEYISEWAPYTHGKYPTFSLLILLMILVSDFRDNRIPIADRLLTFGLTIAALTSIRHFSILMAISAPHLAFCLSQPLLRFPSHVKDTIKSRMAIAAGSSVALLLIATLSPQFFGRNKDLVIPNRDLPQKGIAYVREHMAGKNILNDYSIGGYLIYYAGDVIKVFSDGRANTVYPEPVLKDLILFTRMRSGWQQAMSKYPIDAIMVGPKHAFAIVYDQGSFRKDWKQVYRDKQVVIYDRIGQNKPQPKKPSAKVDSSK